MRCKKILAIVIISISMIIFALCMYSVLKDMGELKENNESTDNLIEESIEINEKTREKYIDWDYLKSVNEDIVAWIEIEGTNINYPILKDKDVYYLKHSFDKKYNSNGSIFTTNLAPFKDAETVIYGHNMRTESMFSNLSNYWNEDFLYSHLKFKIYTPECDYEATVFSVYSIGITTENNNIKSLDFNERIKYYEKVSKFDIENNVNINKIVKLSTCSYINAKTRPTDQRYFIVANIIPI